MRILLDECVDHRLRTFLPEHDCESAAYAKFTGLKNGVLLTAAEAAGFEVIITTDQEIPYQQNLSDRSLSIIILCAASNRLKDLRPLLPSLRETLTLIKPGQTMRVS